MENRIIIEGLTGEEIMHFTLLFCYNWNQEDFEIVFKDSRLGWDYYWDKLQGKIKSGSDPAEAILSVLLNMDNTHKPMLFSYLFEEKYPKEIKNKREMRKLVDDAKAKHLKKIPNELKGGILGTGKDVKASNPPDIKDWNNL